MNEEAVTEPELSTIGRIAELIANRLEIPEEAQTLVAETRLGDEGIGLDSLMIVELALDFEEAFNVEIGEEEMLDIGSMDISQVAQLIERHQAEVSA